MGTYRLYEADFQAKESSRGLDEFYQDRAHGA